jgi:hypothetical protein
MRRRTNGDDADDDHGKVDHDGPDGCATAADDRYDYADAAIHALIDAARRRRCSPAASV